MDRSRRIVVAAVAAAVLAAALLTIVLIALDEPAAEGGPRIVQPGAPGQSGRTLSPEELARLSAPPHTSADTAFMQRMLQHHAQALEMTALVDDRTQSEDIPLLAERIEVSQRDEIRQIEQWLADRGEGIPQPHASHPGHDQLMPGMLNDVQLNQLRQATGIEFDRLFLQFMIYHHQGALVMVQELYASGGGLEPASDRFARDVQADQSIEIRRMQDLLTARSS